jgi:TolB-like protein
MRLGVISCVILALLIGLSTSILAKEKVAVFEFEGIGMDRQSIEAATEIFRSELTRTGDFTVVPKGDMETMLSGEGITDYRCNDPECASEYGYIVGAELATIGSLTKLGEKITAEVQLVDVLKKEVVFSDRFPASSLDDLDATLRKLAEAVASRREIESEITRYGITEEEAGEPRRKRGFVSSGAMLGFGFPLGDSYSRVDNLYAIYWPIRYEASRYVVETSIGLMWGSTQNITVDGVDLGGRHVTVFPWDIGMRYVFSRESDLTGFVGGGIGIHFIASEESEMGADIVTSDTAPALHFCGGIYAFQTYDFHLTVEGRYTAVFSDAFRGSEDTSHQVAILIGVTRRIERKEERGCTSCWF